VAETRRKIQIAPGVMKDAVLVQVDTATEKPNVYHLADGSVITLRVVVTEIWKVDGEYDVEGNPFYLVKSANVATVQSPETLRQGDP